MANRRLQKAADVIARHKPAKAALQQQLAEQQRGFLHSFTFVELCFPAEGPASAAAARLSSSPPE